MTPEAVAETLGGSIIEDPPAADDVEAGDAPQEQAAEAAVGTTESPNCGTGFEGGEPTVQGCGTQIVTEEQGGDQNGMQVEIAQLKTRSNLCNACFAAWRAANKKGV